MNRCIGFRSTVVISYAQIQYQHLQAADSGIDANSALTVSTSQKIQIWCYFSWLMTSS
jgi:hypothetical protein